MASTVGIILLIIGLKVLSFLLYWFWVEWRKKVKARRAGADRQLDEEEQQQQQQPDHQRHQQQQQQRHQQPQQQQNLPENPPPAYEDVVNLNKYPIYVISYEGLEEEPGVKPPAYEISVRNSTTDTTAVQNQ